jgi:pimeloyl-ACP methyl ester carboxylesterase
LVAGCGCGASAFRRGKGKVHRGFYEAYKALKDFVQDYLDQFHAGQKIIISGHSLGGAIALLLAEALRNATDNNYDVLLYTYGAPRTGDATFVAAAEPLAHHRAVNNNDMIPSVPAPWMNARRSIWIPGFKAMFITNPVLGALIFVAGLVRVGGAPYQHHGTLHHFMLVPFSRRKCRRFCGGRAATPSSRPPAPARWPRMATCLTATAGSPNS